MILMRVTPDLDKTPWEDLKALREQGKVITALNNEACAIRVGGLPKGMASGRTCVAIALTLPDGTVILTETSLALFLSAADILRAVYPNG